MFKAEKKIAEIYSVREKEAHKFDFGSLLVVGGSKIYSGSPTFNALGALRSGVDLVEIAAPERSANIIASFSPDLITHPLPGNYIKRAHLETLNKVSQNKTAIVIGGGMNKEKETLLAIVSFLSKIKLPCVIDADAIHAISLKRELLRGKMFVLTPHAMEFYALTGQEVYKEMDFRKSQVIEAAKKLKTTILLKGNIDVISDGENVYLNETGTPYMTKGGTGDILAGICGALLARGVEPFEAACCAAYISGRAGEIASKKYGESLLASDILREIPAVINK